MVGLGARAQLFTEALAGPHSPYADRIELVGFCDVDTHRMAVHNDWLTAAHPGRVPVRAYAAADFDEMPRRERVDLVVVCTMDRTHDDYIVRALEAGCDVVTEKPMTIDAARARRILQTQRRTGRDVRVAFNYRYNPAHSAVRELIATGEGGHGGGDVRMLADLFGGRPSAPDPLGRAADGVDGARSLVTGLAANRSFETGMPVAVRELLDV